MVSALPTGRHVVLATADSEAFASLRRRATSRAERRATGKALRQSVPRSALGRWSPRRDRPNPIELIKKSHEGRLPELIGVRVARMVTSPYGFLRGTAIVMATDFCQLAGDGCDAGGVRRRASGQLWILRVA